MPVPEPLPYCRTQLATRRTSEAHLSATDRRLSLVRLLIVGTALVVAWAAFWPGWLSGWWLLVPLVVFGWVMHAHDRIVRAHQTARRAVGWYERALARFEDAWVGIGSDGVRFLDTDHPYARDLDLFGEGSLFELLNTTQTTIGEETLAAWLLAAADPGVIVARQQAVSDLAARPQLREDLYTVGADAHRVVDSTLLDRWATSPPALGAPWLRVVPLGLAGAMVISTVAFFIDAVPAALPLTVLLVNAGIGIALNQRVSRVLHGSSEPARELVILAAVFARLRNESYDSDRLQRLHAKLNAERTDPVAAVTRLDRLIQRHDWQHNLMFAPFAAAVLWSVQCAVAVEAWRARHGAFVSEWLSVVGEFEALAAFATYRFEHPDHPFPTVVGRTTPPVFEAEDLAHPLLPRAAAIANDLRLGVTPQLLLVSGSNMSGKTTLLRTVGANGVLALAGAPVRARTLRISPVSIGGTLRVQDSLLSGRSRFYAEILKVKQLVEIAKGPHALLFLMDELFHGTNSHDRVEGAHGVLEFLVDLGAVGIVTTHDLALAGIGDRLESRAANVHFADELVQGALAFDYRLRDGRSTQGNALALMRAVGLDVKGSEQTA